MASGNVFLLIVVLGDYSPRHMALEPDLATFFVICAFVSVVLHVLNRSFVLACIASVVAIHVVEYIVFAITDGAGPHVMWSFPSVLATLVFASPITVLIGGIVVACKRSRQPVRRHPVELQAQDFPSGQASEKTASPVSSCRQCHQNLTVFLLTQSEPLENLSCPRCGAKLAQEQSKTES